MPIEWSYLDENESGNRRQIGQLGIVERVGRVVGHVRRDAENLLDRVRRPIGRREREPVVRAGVHRSNLDDDDGAAAQWID